MDGKQCADLDATSSLVAMVTSETSHSSAPFVFFLVHFGVVLVQHHSGGGSPASVLGAWPQSWPSSWGRGAPGALMEVEGAGPQTPVPVSSGRSVCLTAPRLY